MTARPVGTWFLAAAGVAVVAALIAALLVIGSPMQQRAQRFDERRVQDLMRLQRAVESFATSEKRLPKNLQEIAGAATGRSVDLLDPQSGERYGYRIVSERRYELCVRFATVLRKGDGAESFYDEEWLHPAGRHCFVRTLVADGSIDKAAADAAAAAADAMSASGEG